MDCLENGVSNVKQKIDFKEIDNYGINNKRS